MSLTRLAPLSLVLAAACSPMALSPAIRTIPLETAETARLGHVAVRAGGGGHADDWGHGVATAQGGLGIGVAPDVELQLDGSFADALSLEGRSVSPFVGAARVGVKHRVLDWLALSGGTGVGSGPWGAYTGSDLGLIFAYENPYVVPFFAARMQLSVPIDPWTETYVDSNGAVSRLTPSATFWFQPSTGIRIPLCGHDDCDGARVSLTLAVAWTSILEIDASHGGGGLGGEAGLTLEP